MSADHTSSKHGAAIEAVLVTGGLCWLIAHGYIWWGFAGSAGLLIAYTAEDYVCTACVSGSLLAAAFVSVGSYGMAICLQVPLVVMLHGNAYYLLAGLGSSVFIAALIASFLWGQAPEVVTMDGFVPAAVDDEPLEAQQAHVNELGKSIHKWRENRSKLCALATKLERERAEILRQLNRWGVNSLSESSTDPRAKVLLDELRDVLAQQKLVRGKYERYDLAIVKAEARLRSIERRVAAQGVGINDSELAHLVRIVIDLDESLALENKSEVPHELDPMLAEQFEQRRSPPANGK